MQIDLHGYHPREIVFNGTLAKIVQQAWEMGEGELTLVHGHGRNRGISPVCHSTNHLETRAFGRKTKVNKMNEHKDPRTDKH